MAEKSKKPSKGTTMFLSRGLYGQTAASKNAKTIRAMRARRKENAK